MTDEELNRYVHEVIHGEGSWFNFSNDGERLPQPNYLEHGKPWRELLNWAMEQEWWSKFIYQTTSRVAHDQDYLTQHEAFIDGLFIGFQMKVELFSNPRSLPEHIVSYLKQEEVNGNTSASS